MNYICIFRSLGNFVIVKLVENFYHQYPGTSLFFHLLEEFFGGTLMDNILKTELP
jgi:hypothetical protein